MGSCLCALALALSAGSSAAETRTSLPAPAPLPAAEALELRAETAELDPARNILRLAGNVTLRGAGMELSSQQVEVRYGAGEAPETVIGEGEATVRVGAVRASAQGFELSIAAHTLTLTGGVQLSLSAGSALADRAVMNTRTGRLTLQRVRGSLPLSAPTLR